MKVCSKCRLADAGFYKPSDSWCRRCHNAHHAQKRATRAEAKARELAARLAAERQTGRVCSKCGVLQPLDAFPAHKDCPNGREARCKRCCLERFKRARQRHYERNAQEVRSKVVQYRAENAADIAVARRAARARDRAELNDRYVLHLLVRQGSALKAREVPTALIEAKRMHLAIERHINNEAKGQR